MTIGEKIKERRLEIGISNREFAKKVGVSHVAVLDWQKGNRNPRKPTVKVICQTLNLDPETLEPIDIYHNSMYSELCDLVVGYDELNDERLVLIQEKAFNRFLRKYWNELKCTKAKD
jgi:transcriptional regulator with XRE-family HTH domain